MDISDQPERASDVPLKLNASKYQSVYIGSYLSGESMSSGGAIKSSETLKLIFRVRTDRPKVARVAKPLKRQRCMKKPVSLWSLSSIICIQVDGRRAGA